MSDPDDGSGCRDAERRAPTFRELLAANLRVVAWAGVAGVTAYGVWRGLRALFPEIGWLQ